jgi:hypothetical protein
VRKIIGAAVAALFATSACAAGFGDLLGSFAGRYESYGAGREAQAKQLDDVLLKVSEYMNKRMPEQVDPETRLDRVSAEPGAHFSYHYTLVDSASTNVDKANFSSSIRSKVKNSVCASSQIRNFFNHGVTVGYLYQGKDGLPVGGTDFTPTFCDDVKEAPSRP